jgi:hypothetical protein
MKSFGSILRCASVAVLAVALNLMVPGSSPALGPLNVNVVNTPLRVQGTVNVGNFPASTVLKPSQLVTVSAHLEGFCPDPVGGKAFNRFENSDGSESIFGIPGGQVLIITAAEVIGTNPASAGHAGLASLSRIGVPGFNNEIAVVRGTIDSAGTFSGQFDLPIGAVVKPGVRLCGTVRDLNSGGDISVSGVIRGYLTEDE